MSSASQRIAMGEASISLFRQHAIRGGAMGSGKTFSYLAWFHAEHRLLVKIEKRRFMEFVR